VSLERRKEIKAGGIRENQDFNRQRSGDRRELSRVPSQRGNYVGAEREEKGPSSGEGGVAAMEHCEWVGEKTTKRAVSKESSTQKKRSDTKGGTGPNAAI